jgi:glycosyltransferase involved in cell wall biosynthesis
VGGSLKILLVNSFFPPWRGGAETYIYNLARNLQARGHEVSVVCGSPPVKAGTRHIDRVRVKRLRVAGRVYGTPIIPELALRLMQEESPDIIHAGFPSPYNAFFASVASRLRGIPAVLTWHNDLPAVARAARAIATVHEYAVLPLYLGNYQFLISTSRLYAETSRVLRAHRERVVIIPHGVDTVKFNPHVRADELRRQIAAGNRKIILFVGALTRWHTYKGLDVLMNAVALLKDESPNLKLLVVGGGDLASRYLQLASDLGISDHVFFAGNISDDELPKYYAISDVLVLPSKDRCEGFGLVLLEANAAGKPVIGSAVGGIPSVIQNGYNGILVPPNDPNTLAATMKRVLQDEDLLRQMGKNGRAFAKEHDWSIVVEQTERVYEKALNVEPRTFLSKPIVAN